MLTPLQGTGEAIRGEFNAAIDKAAGDQSGVVHNKEIANKGVNEWDTGYRGHNAGVTPVDTEAERMNTTGPTGATSTNYGPHSTNTANKLDPRVDSDLDHRGTVTDSTNYGPHSTNVGNKLDPRVDSDADHRANPASAMNPGVGGTDYSMRR